MNNFINIENIGNLQIEQVFVESYYPALFTCRNENDELFLCSCYQSNKDGEGWLVTRTTSEIVNQMLIDEITIREAFTKNKECQITIKTTELANGDFNVFFNDEGDWDFEHSKVLPDSGEYMELDDDEVEWFLCRGKNREKGE